MDIFTPDTNGFKETNSDIHLLNMKTACLWKQKKNSIKKKTPTIFFQAHTPRYSYIFSAIPS